jgi:hypothetical protein
MAPFSIGMETAIKDNGNRTKCGDMVFSTSKTEITTKETS